jgi:hypothetical protein
LRGYGRVWCSAAWDDRYLCYYTRCENFQAFRVPCAYASRIGSGKSSSATKSCACAFVVLLAGIISLAVDCKQYILLLVGLTRGPQPLPKRVLHTVQSSASSFNSQYPLFTVRSSSSCLCLLSRLLFPSVLVLSFPK